MWWQQATGIERVTKQPHRGGGGGTGEHMGLAPMVGPAHVFGCMQGAVLQGAKSGLCVCRHANKRVVGRHPGRAVRWEIKLHTVKRGSVGPNWGFWGKLGLRVSGAGVCWYGWSVVPQHQQRTARSVLGLPERIPLGPPMQEQPEPPLPGALCTVWGGRTLVQEMYPPPLV